VRSAPSHTGVPPGCPPVPPRRPEVPGVAVEPAARPCYLEIVRRPTRSLPGSAVAAVTLAALALGGCPRPGGPGGGGECFVDEECAAGEVCARDELCWPEDQVRRVETRWTVRGMPASATTCAGHPDLHIRFDGNVADDLGFAPVPCEVGQFTVDRLPRPFTLVELSVDNGGPGRTTTIDALGMAVLDLPF